MRDGQHSEVIHGSHVRVHHSVILIKMLYVVREKLAQQRQEIYAWVYNVKIYINLFLLKTVFRRK
jgi:hypothetical protein